MNHVAPPINLNCKELLQKELDEASNKSVYVPLWCFWIICHLMQYITFKTVYIKMQTSKKRKQSRK